MTHIAVLVGSLRADSINKKIAKTMEGLAPDGVTISYLDIADVPLFSQDLEAAVPAAVKALKEGIEAADGVLIVTPEYNRGVPGVLKNALDWASRPYGQNSFAKKPVAVGGATGSPWGTVAAQQQVKTVLLYLDAHVMGQPELFIGASTPVYDEQGAVTPESAERLTAFMSDFVQHIERTR